MYSVSRVCYICGEKKHEEELLPQTYYYKNKEIHICLDCEPDVDFLHLVQTELYSPLEKETIYSLIPVGQNKYRQIYFILNKDKRHIKIGLTTNYRRRLAELRSEVVDELQPLLVVTANPALEKRLHSMFHKSRVKGEWFRVTPELIETMENIETVAKHQGHCVFTAVNKKFLTLLYRHE